MKVVINHCFGGFGLSPEATLKLYERGVTEIATPVDEYYGQERDPESTLGRNYSLRKWREYLSSDKSGRGSFITVFTPDEKHVLYVSSETIPRHHAELVRVVEEMGDKASGSCAELAVVEIPDGVEYVIEEYDGNEHIAEVHRTWR
jgi:hypothetical protein